MAELQTHGHEERRATDWQPGSITAVEKNELIRRGEANQWCTRDYF